jgi:cerevisin
VSHFNAYTLRLAQLHLWFWFSHESDPLQLDGDDKSGIRHVFDEGVKGYTGMFTESVVDKIREMPEVEKDQTVRITPVDTQLSAP